MTPRAYTQETARPPHRKYSTIDTRESVLINQSRVLVYENASQFGQAPVVDAEPVEGFLEPQQLPVHHLEGHD